MTKQEVNYQKLSTELDEIVAKLQAHDLDVDEATNLYARGMLIAKQLEGHLKDAENKVTKVKTDWEARSKG